MLWHTVLKKGVSDNTAGEAKDNKQKGDRHSLSNSQSGSTLTVRFSGNIWNWTNRSVSFIIIVIYDLLHYLGDFTTWNIAWVNHFSKSVHKNWKYIVEYGMLVAACESNAQICNNNNDRALIVCSQERIKKTVESFREHSCKVAYPKTLFECILKGTIR